MLLLPLTKFEIQRYYQNESSKFVLKNDVYSRNNLPKKRMKHM